MKEFNSIGEILDFAIASEQEAMDFYTSLATQTNNENMKEVFKQFAAEENGHKAKLTAFKQTGKMKIDGKKVADLKLSDYLVDIEVKPDMSYQEVLIVAMKKEKAAFKLYMDLSNNTSDEGTKNLFISLAEEESRHKLRFEIEYDEYILREN